MEEKLMYVSIRTSYAKWETCQIPNMCVCRMNYSIKSKFKFGIKFHSSFGKWVVEMNNEINIAIINFTFYSLRKHYFSFETISPKWTKEKF